MDTTTDQKNIISLSKSMNWMLAMAGIFLFIASGLVAIVDDASLMPTASLFVVTAIMGNTIVRIIKSLESRIVELESRLN